MTIITAEGKSAYNPKSHYKEASFMNHAESPLKAGATTGAQRQPHPARMQDALRELSNSVDILDDLKITITGCTAPEEATNIAMAPDPIPSVSAIMNNTPEEIETLSRRVRDLCSEIESALL